MHSLGIVHCDIKPSNILVAPGNERSLDRLYLVDYGLATHYMNPNTRQFLHGTTKRGPRGTLSYASVSCHRGMGKHTAESLTMLAYAPRDDLVSLCYTLAKLLRGSLPWERVWDQNKKKRTRKNEIMMMKTTTCDLFSGFPPGFDALMNYVHTLSCRDVPDYPYMRNLMSRAGGADAIAFKRCK